MFSWTRVIKNARPPPPLLLLLRTRTFRPFTVLSLARTELSPLCAQPPRFVALFPRAVPVIPGFRPVQFFRLLPSNTAASRGAGYRVPAKGRSYVGHGGSGAGWLSRGCKWFVCSLGREGEIKRFANHGSVNGNYAMVVFWGESVSEIQSLEREGS